MALVVDTTKRYRNIPNGQNFTFSLSKPLNQLTPSDLQSADFWVGFNCCSINQIYEGKGGEGIPENNPNYCNLWGTDPSWWYDQTNWASVHWSYPANQPNGLYMRNVYINRDLNAGDYTVANSTARIVLEITPDEDTTIQKLCMVDNSNYLQAEYNTSIYDNQMADYTYISPAVLLVINNCVYLINQNVQRFFVPNNIGFYINATTDQGYSSYFPSFENLSYHKLAMGWTMAYTTGSIEDNCVKTGTGSAPIYTYNDVDFNGHTGILQLTGGGTNYHIRIGCTMSANADDSDFSLIHRAYTGVRFKVSGTWYKPIIEDGIVIGYTDDMTVPSEWDTWTKASGHNVPVSPTPGPTPGPYDDDPWHGASFSGVGVGGAGAFARVYYMTSTELANLRTWMNSISVPEGFDPMQQIIGLSQVPVALSGSSPENVVFVNSSAVYDPGVTTRAVDTGVATQQAKGTPISYYLGSVDIVRRMQDRGEPYLDYDCQIELYLPLIGMFSLDTQAIMGRTIYAYAVLDPVSGTLAAYAYVTKDGENLPVAYGSTTIGVDLPVSAQQLSVSRAALKQANAQLATSLLSSALTIMSAASSGNSSGSGAKTSTGSSGVSAAGIREAGSDYMKASQVGSVFGDFMQWGRTIRQLYYGNNTAIAGSFGGSTAQWSYPFTPYVKIIRPRYEKPSNYAHSQGVPCVQTKTIGSCSGFVQCIGVDVSGISGATDLELQAIQAALSNGIYAGGGQ